LGGEKIGALLTCPPQGEGGKVRKKKRGSAFSSRKASLPWGRSNVLSKLKLVLSAVKERDEVVYLGKGRGRSDRKGEKDLGSP